LGYGECSEFWVLVFYFKHSTSNYGSLYTLHSALYTHGFSRFVVKTRVISISFNGSTFDPRMNAPK